jgi:hypothetical protein
MSWEPGPLELDFTEHHGHSVVPKEAHDMPVMPKWEFEYKRTAHVTLAQVQPPRPSY